jgi:pimeloyl-ACP methyl ester carboxylesterase
VGNSGKGESVVLPTYDDRYVEVGGKRIRYWAAGEGPAVVLVHGLSNSAEFWQYNIAALAVRHRVYALDLLGFGKSDKEIGQFSLPYAAAFMADFLDAVGVGQASLVGNSLGGVICAQTAAQYPERVERLILVDPAGFGRELNPFLRVWSIPRVGSGVFWIYQRLFPRVKNWVFYNSACLDEAWVANVAEVLRSPGVRENVITVARTGVSLRGGQREELFRDLHRLLAASSVPTLIIWGSRDFVVPLAHAYAAQKVIPNSEVRVMRRCGHIPQVERPDEFNALVLDFLRASGCS